MPGIFDRDNKASNRFLSLSNLKKLVTNSKNLTYGSIIKQNEEYCFLKNLFPCPFPPTQGYLIAKVYLMQKLVCLFSFFSNFFNLEEYCLESI